MIVAPFAAAVLRPDSTTALAAVVLTLTGLFLLRRGPAVLRGTTLLAPWTWAVAAIIAIGSVELILAGGFDAPFPWADHLRFVAATLTFGPMMAQLGAKRPQNRAWQLIVLSLVGIVALPAVEAWLRDRHEFDMHAVRSWFLLVLIIVGVINNLPTRFGRSTLIFGVAQLALFWPHLPWGDAAEIRPTPLFGLGLIDVALWILVRSRANVMTPNTSNHPLAGEPFQSFNRLWRDFRDWYGAVWSLRVLERVNVAAHQQGWNATLDWDGFVRLPDISDDAGSVADSAKANNSSPAEIVPNLDSSDVAPSIDKVFRGLLWRFVSDAWIESRLRSSEQPEPTQARSSFPRSAW